MATFETWLEMAEGEYKEWMRRVDIGVCALLGVTTQDLPDMLHRDAFDDGYTPEEWANQIYEEMMND